MSLSGLLAKRFAVTALADSARWWLTQGRLDEAASLFAISILLGAVAAQIDVDVPAGEAPITSEGAQSMLMPTVLMVMYATTELADGAIEFYDQVFTVLDEQYGGIGHQLRFVLDTAREAVDTLGEPSQEE